MHIRTRAIATLAVATLAVLLVLLCGVPARAATPGTTADPDEPPANQMAPASTSQPDDSVAQAEPGPTDRTRVASPLPPLEPGHDVERGPIGLGEQFRLWTQLTDAEIHAADPSFRALVDLIRTGQADKRVMRLYWFYRSRLDPFTSLVPEGWRQRGMAALHDETRTRGALFSFAARERAAADAPAKMGTPPAPVSSDVSPKSASASTGPQSTLSGTAGISPWGVWVPVGPFNIPGRACGLDRPEGEPETLYVAAADGGLWRTRDAGQHWETLTDNEATQSGGAVLVDQSNPNVIYFGTGEGNTAIDNYGGIGVLKSTDGGKTWHASNPFSGSIRRLAMHRSEPSRIYAAGDSGCYLSTDAGATFSLISTGGLPTNAGASDVLVRPDDPNRVFCAIWGGDKGGIYRSTDHGATWTLLTQGLPPVGAVGRISLNVSRSNPDIMLAGIQKTQGSVFKSTDGGTTWTELAGGSGGYCGGQCWYDNVVGIDPVDPNIMYIGGVGQRRSTDGGATWAPDDAGVHVDYHFIFAPTPNEVIVANDGGVYRSRDAGTTWTNIGLGMDTAQYYGICRHPSDPYWAFGGTQDEGSHRRRQGDIPEWQMVLGGDGGMCMTGPPDGSIILGEYQNLNVQRSTDGGASWLPATGGIPATDPHPWVGLLVADPSNRLNMWTSTDHMLRSLDARETNWTSASGKLYFNLNVTAIDVAPSNGNVVYHGYDAGGLFVSTNALARPPSWTNIRAAAMPQRAVRRIRVHPNDAATVYVVFSGYGTGKIWKSMNTGATFTEVSGDLPDVPINDLVVDGDNPGSLIAATDLGVFRSDTDGAHWYGWSSGLPTVASIEMTWDRTSDKLRLGTHGRSMWDWQEASLRATAVPDGGPVPGTKMTVERIGTADMRVHWDTRSCTSRDYNLFYGDLAEISRSLYAGAQCGLGTSGSATVPMPVTPSGNAFFVVAATDGAGSEGPHGVTASGTATPFNGIGSCGITAQDSLATCP